MPILSHLHYLFSTEDCQAYIHTLGSVSFRATLD